ncbi:hypothetical protein SAMN02800692_2724, partial [Luteibacter sp. UNC138MFCol5.1]
GRSCVCGVATTERLAVGTGVRRCDVRGHVETLTIAPAHDVTACARTYQLTPAPTPTVLSEPELDAPIDTLARFRLKARW